MRPCCACGVMYEPNRDKSYRCPKCKSDYNKQHYEQNKSVYIARAVARKTQVVRDLNIRINEYLVGHPCIDCGESNPVVLEFDHIEQKSYDIAIMVAKGHSWNSISGEIAKCEVRCANCHRRITAKRGNWMKHRLNEQ